MGHPFVVFSASLFLSVHVPLHHNQMVFTHCIVFHPSSFSVLSEYLCCVQLPAHVTYHGATFPLTSTPVLYSWCSFCQADSVVFLLKCTVSACTCAKGDIKLRLTDGFRTSERSWYFLWGISNESTASFLQVSQQLRLNFDQSLWIQSILTGALNIHHCHLKRSCKCFERADKVYHFIYFMCYFLPYVITILMSGSNRCLHAECKQTPLSLSTSLCIVHLP